MYVTVFLGLALSSSLLLTFCWLKLAINRRWFDMPNQRSSHEAPTPKSGGIAFVCVYIGFTSLLYYSGYIVAHEYWLCMSGLLLAGTGLLDDLHELGIAGRLTIQLAVVVLAVFLLPGMPELSFGSWVASSTLLVACLLVPGWVWLVNLYNFMDGIDALAASEAIFVSLALAGITAAADLEHMSLLCLLLAVVTGGFLYFNVSPARIFMGDSGSNFLGFILGALGLLAVWYEAMTLWTLLILLAVFIVDSTLILLKRMAAGLVWYHGHRSHAYQQAASLHKSHLKVVMVICAINILWLLPLAWISVLSTGSGVWLTLLAWLPLVWLAHRYQSIAAVDHIGQRQ